MDQDIPHACYLMPRNGRVFRGKLRWQMSGRFTDNFESSDDCILYFFLEMKSPKVKFCVYSFMSEMLSIM
jgi:hypothetical protein